MKRLGILLVLAASLAAFLLRSRLLHRLFPQSPIQTASNSTATEFIPTLQLPPSANIIDSAVAADSGTSTRRYAIATMATNEAYFPGIMVSR